MFPVMKLFLHGKERFQMSEMEPIKIQAVNSLHHGSRKDVRQEGCMAGRKNLLLARM